MARAGGEAGKLGNRFESIWTVDHLLDVFTGEAEAMIVEPFGEEALGIEFIKTHADGRREFHSAKRQTTTDTWSLAHLTRPENNGRSILGDLITKIEASAQHAAVFVSGVTASDLIELWQIAANTRTEGEFVQRLASQPAIKAEFDRRVLPLVAGKTVAAAWAVLRRLEVVGITEPQLIKQVERKVRQHVYRPDGAEVDPVAVRLLLAESVFARFGQTIDRAQIEAQLAAHGFRERDWQRDRALLDTVARRNDAYTRHVTAELIEGSAIVRDEAKVAVEALLNSAHSRVAVVGAAGLGKSCVVAQVLVRLRELGVPHLALRMDVQTQVLASPALGQALDLPESPVMVLAGMAGGGAGVLLVDQLDALSVVSGRHQGLWTVFDELLAEAERYPRLKVLLACRAFDAEHDNRLRRLLGDQVRTRRIELAPLSLDAVRDVLRRAKIDPATLAERELAILQTPQHLSLFLQGDSVAGAGVGTVQALLDRYWEAKGRWVRERLGAANPSRWMEAVSRLTRWLSEHQTLSAPLDVLDGFRAEADALASEHVLVQDGRTWRFFHETVFDYAFARVFVADGGSAIRLLREGGEQHLFRRAQVRQILTYERDRSRADYLTDLRAVLTEPPVRLHVKKLVLDWLRTLPDPRAEEWALLQTFPTGSLLGRWARTVPFGSVGWFDRLDADGTWRRWLVSGEVAEVDHALWLLSREAVVRERAGRVAALVAPVFVDTEEGRRRFLGFARFAELHHGRELFELLVRALRAGWLDDVGDHWWYHFHDLPQKAPALAVELTDEFLARLFARYPTGNPFREIEHREGLPEDFPELLAKHAAPAVVERLLPRIVAEVRQRPVEDDPGSHRDELWPSLSLTSDYDFEAKLLKGLTMAMGKVAQEDPAALDRQTSAWEAEINQTQCFLLLTAWMGNPAHYADRIVRYLAAHPSRLDTGYAAWGGGGTGEAAVARAAITVAAPVCSQESLARLEEAILAFRDEWEAKHPRWRGNTEYLLLACLPRERMSRRTRLRFEELERKFPEQDFSPPEEGEVDFVGPPIKQDAARKMSDAHWVSAMSKYAQDRDRARIGRDFFKGGLHELARVLEKEAQKGKGRFARLLLALPDDIAPAYFEALVRGLGTVHVENADEEKAWPSLKEPLSDDLLWAVLRRVDRLPGRPGGRWICDAISKAAERAVPDDILALVSTYAVHDPDPAAEKWQAPVEGRTPLYGGDALTAGINSTRGRAAWAIGALLFGDGARWSALRGTVEALVADRSIAVRACVMRCLLAVMNFDRAQAVRLFQRLVEDCQAVLGTGDVDRFLHHAVHSHYDELRPILKQMLASSDPKAVEAAARQIAVAAFDQADAEAKADLAQVMTGDELVRKTAMGVFAHNLGSARVGAACARWLRVGFADPAKEVRQEAASGFRQLNGDQLTAQTALIGEFLMSLAFGEGGEGLLLALQRSEDMLPDVVCAVMERIVDLQTQKKDEGEAAPRLGEYYAPELVLRLYRQTGEVEVRQRCLDLMDRMLEGRFSGLDEEMRKLER